MNTVYDVYQFFFHIGRYGDHKKIATYKNESDAQRRVDQIWSTGQTASYKPREV
tara:strand:+ start:435 stop:596 length:162 start_codon:yes stop_codon:yes gene_type:complete